MFEIQAENRDLTDRDINQPKETHKKGLLLGTDFRHAVEFSRSGRAPMKPSRALSMAACIQPYAATGCSRRRVLRLTSRPRRRIENHTRHRGGLHRGPGALASPRTRSRSEAQQALDAHGQAWV